MTVMLAVVIAFIAKDLTMPLLLVAAIGVFDRVLGDPILRTIDR